MSRETQYIGLNEYARTYINKNSISSIENFHLTNGMFDEVITGCIYHMIPTGVNKDLILRETVQCVPWSSGPMIFTYLKATLIKESGQQINFGDWFMWMIDPSIENEIDFKTGRYWV